LSYCFETQLKLIYSQHQAELVGLSVTSKYLLFKQDTKSIAVG